MSGVNARRQEQMAGTRAAIVASAARLFTERGYAGTTVAAIAGGAGVVVQTVYNSVGSKSAVLSAVLDLAAAGPEAPRTVPEFMRERSAAPRDGAGLIAVLADWFAEVQPRTATVHRIIRQAAAVDPDIAELEDRRAAQRFHNYFGAARELATRADSAQLPVDDVAAVIWTVGHPQVYRFLVEQQGWDLDRYRAWLARMLAAALTEAR